MPDDPPESTRTPLQVTPEKGRDPRPLYLYEYPEPLVLIPGYKWLLYTIGPDYRELTEEERIARQLPVAMLTTEGTHDLVLYRHIPDGGRKKRSTRRRTKKRNGVSRSARRRV